MVIMSESISSKYPEVILTRRTCFPLLDKLRVVHPDGYHLLSVKTDSILTNGNCDTESNHSNGTPDSSVLDLTGSPLKPPEDMAAKLAGLEISQALGDESVEYCDSYSALSLIHARSYISHYNLSNPNQSDKLPIWVMCDGEDENRTVLMHCRNTDTSLESGSILLSGSNLKVTDLPNMASLNMEHGRYGGQQVSREISAQYELYQHIKYSGSFLKVNCSWSTCKTTLSCPTSDAKMSISIGVDLANDDCLKAVAVQELEEIGMLISGLKTLEIAWPSKNPSHQLMEEVKECVMRRKRTQYYDYYSQQYADKQTKRKFVDFTDELWDVLRNCCLYKDLSSAFEFVFNMVATKMFSPVIASDNTTQAGRLLNKLVSNDDDFSAYLLGTKPMEMLIEIALLSFERQVVSMMIEENKYISPNEVLSFVKFSTYEGHHSCLGKLLILLESLSLWRKYIKTSTGSAPSRLKETVLPELFAHSEPVTSQVFSLQLPTKDLIEVIKDLDPLDWMLTLTSKNKRLTVVTKDLFTMYEYPFVGSRCKNLSSEILNDLQRSTYNWFHMIETHLSYTETSALDLMAT